MLFISPWVQQHSVIRAPDPQHPFDHTSWLATLLTWFGLDPACLGKRTAAAPMFDAVIGDIMRVDIDLPPLADIAPESAMLDKEMSPELAMLATKFLASADPGSDRMEILTDIVNRFSTEKELFAYLRERQDDWVARNTTQ